MSAQRTLAPYAPGPPRAGSCSAAPGQSGVTLIEIIIVLVIGGILVSLAVPSFREMARNNILVTETNSLIGDIQVMRSEAAKRGVPGILCSSASPMATSPACGGTFATGWVTFADVDSSGAFNSGDVVIRRRSAPATGVTIDMTNAASNKLTFLSTGALSGTSPVTVAVCDSRGASSGRELTLSATGRPNLTVGSAESPITTCTP